MRAGELGRRNIWGRWRAGFLTVPKWSQPRSILGTVSLLRILYIVCVGAGMQLAMQLGASGVPVVG
eukprot:COSAG06_NODE_40165_length_404_cov_2.032787_1_plen_65_part_01